MPTRPTRPALVPTAASWLGPRLELLDGVHRSRAHRELGEGSDGQRHDGRRKGLGGDYNKVPLADRRDLDRSATRLSLGPQLLGRAVGVARAVAHDAALIRPLTGGQVETGAVVEEDRGLSRRHNQEHEKADRQGELDQALAALIVA